ncbi:MAG: cytochrome b N-terminal domain-containing protein [Acidobacteriota bacterium]
MKLIGGLAGAAGIVCLLSLVLLLTSGWALMAGYVPSDVEAFSSILFARQQTPDGSTARNAHFYLSMVLVIAGFLYLLATYLAGSHIENRSRWWLAVSIYLLVLGFCFTGYLLPMDQNAYWGTVVRLGIVETVPVIGPVIAQLLRGGGAFNASTLPRFYALHVAILPLLAILLLLPLFRVFIARLEALRRPGLWSLVAVAAIVVLYWAVASSTAPLELRADPSDTEYVPRPEWYFLWLFQLGKYVESLPWIESLVVPVVGLTILYALAVLPRQTVALRLAVAATWIAVWTTLTGLALYEDRDLPPKMPYELAMETRAEEAYKDLCLECHGAEGRGDGQRSLTFGLEARDFTQPEVWLEVSEAEMIRTTRDGKGENMPAFGRQLSYEEIVAILAHMKTNFAPIENSPSVG